MGEAERAEQMERIRSDLLGFKKEADRLLSMEPSRRNDIDQEQFEDLLLTWAIRQMRDLEDDTHEGDPER